MDLLSLNPSPCCGSVSGEGPPPIPSEDAPGCSALLCWLFKVSGLFDVYLAAQWSWDCCTPATEPNASATPEKEMLVLLSWGPVCNPFLTGAGCRV